MEIKLGQLAETGPFVAQVFFLVKSVGLKNNQNWCVRKRRPCSMGAMTICLSHRSCLVETVRLTEEAELSCPYTDNNYTCYARLQDREIRAVSLHFLTLYHHYILLF